MKRRFVIQVIQVVIRMIRYDTGRHDEYEIGQISSIANGNQIVRK